MAGRSAAGVLAVPGRVREAANAAAACQVHQQAKGRREEAARKLREAAVGAAGGRTAPKRWRYEEGRDGVAAPKRHRGAAAAGPSCRKRKRDADDDDDGDGPRLPATPPPLRQLLDACRATFNGSTAPPPAPAVNFIRGIMDMIGPDDVGLRREARFFHSMNAAGLQNPQITTCRTIYHCNSFTVAVFLLPPGSVMPLHDHPGMTVFSRLLTGSARVEAYDWVRPGVWAGAAPRRRLAEKVVDRAVAAAGQSGPPGTWVLFPESGGNMHRFVAGWEHGGCAFLDVLTPPYSPQRCCAFFLDRPYHTLPDVMGGALTEEQKRRLAWLQEVSEPQGLVRPADDPPVSLSRRPGRPPFHP